MGFVGGRREEGGGRREEVLNLVSSFWEEEDSRDRYDHDPLCVIRLVSVWSLFLV